MSKSIAELRPELETIAEIVNRFSAPSVQERVAELLLSRIFTEVAAPSLTRVASPAKAPKKPSSPKGGDGNEPAKRRPSSGRIGGQRMLGILIDEGFFSGTKRSLNDILVHAKLKKATTYAPSDFSGALGQAVKQHKLEREPNADGAYVYWAK